MIIGTLLVASALQRSSLTCYRPSLACQRSRALAPILRFSVGDQIIAANDWNSSSPEYGIVRAQSYELQRVYYQGIVDGAIKRVDVDELDAPPPESCAGFRKFYVLFSERYHGNTAPVIVTEAEVQVRLVRDEVRESAWLALPGLFWVWLAYTIYQYGVEHGFVF